MNSTLFAIMLITSVVSASLLVNSYDKTNKRKRVICSIGVLFNFLAALISLVGYLWNYGG